MKIAVIGGTGLIGSKVVKRLRADGHDALAASKDTGVDIITGTGLADALHGAQVVVDVANAPVQAAGVPWTILRATQFFEFIAGIADFSTKDGAVLLPPVLFQPEAARDVAGALADIAEGAPVNGTVELAGPERSRLDELVRRYLSVRGDPRQVVTDASAPYFGVRVGEGTLVPGGPHREGAIGFADWLSQSA